MIFFGILHALQKRVMKMSLASLLLTFSLWGQPAKIHPSLANMRPEETVRVLIQYREGLTERRNARIHELGGTVHHDLQLVRGHAVSLRADEIEALANDPDVEMISPDNPVSATMDTAAAAINASAAWTTNHIGKGIGVAVIDSGVSAHPDLASRVVYSQDFTGEGQNADLYGHGTHVAVALGGSGATSSGANYFKTFKGIAPAVNIVNLRVLNSAGVGTDSTVIAGIQKAISLKSTYNIRVINLSLGRPVTASYTKDPLCQAVESAWKAGIVVVVAAGNYGRNNNSGTAGYGTITAPGNDPYVITVGAMKTMGTPARGDDQIATYSSKGPTLYDHVVKPDIVAPGNQIHSGLTPDKVSAGLFMTYPSTQFPCSYYQTSCGTGNSQWYYVLNGTSMATPMVSAAAAILIGVNPNVTPDQVKARLMKTAFKSFPSVSTVTVSGVTYRDYYDMFTVGAGYLDIQAALANNDVASGNAQSPSVKYNSSTDTGTLQYNPGSTFQGAGPFGSSLLWGTSQLSGSSILWGTSTSFATSLVWGTSGTSAFSLLWGTGTNGTVDPSSLLWGTTVQPGSIAPLVSVLTRGE